MPSISFGASHSPETLVLHEWSFYARVAPDARTAESKRFMFYRDGLLPPSFYSFRVWLAVCRVCVGGGLPNLLALVSCVVACFCAPCICGAALAPVAGSRDAPLFAPCGAGAGWPRPAVPRTAPVLSRVAPPASRASRAGLGPPRRDGVRTRHTGAHALRLSRRASLADLTSAHLSRLSSVSVEVTAIVWYTLTF